MRETLWFWWGCLREAIPSALDAVGESWRSIIFATVVAIVAALLARAKMKREGGGSVRAFFREHLLSQTVIVAIVVWVAMFFGPAILTAPYLKWKAAQTEAAEASARARAAEARAAAAESKAGAQDTRSTEATRSSGPSKNRGEVSQRSVGANSPNINGNNNSVAAERPAPNAGTQSLPPKNAPADPKPAEDPPVQQHSEGPNSPNINGNGNNVTINPEIVRRLSPEQIAVLLEELGPVAPPVGARMHMVGFDPEAYRFGQQFEDVFRKLGWRLGKSSTGMLTAIPNEYEGIVIFAHPDDMAQSTVPAAAIAVASALDKAKIEFRVIKSKWATGNALERGQFEISIGLRKPKP